MHVWFGYDLDWFAHIFVDDVKDLGWLWMTLARLDTIWLDHSSITSPWQRCITSLLDQSWKVDRRMEAQAVRVHAIVEDRLAWHHCLQDLKHPEKLWSYFHHQNLLQCKLSKWTPRFFPINILAIFPTLCLSIFDGRSVCSNNWTPSWQQRWRRWEPLRRPWLASLIRRYCHVDTLFIIIILILIYW